MLAHSLYKMLFVFLLPAFSVAGQEAPAPRVVDLTAPDGLKLKGTFSAAPASGPGALLLHQCNRQRKVWDDLATRMTAAGMNVMTVDLRGYGDSEGRLSCWHTTPTIRKIDARRSATARNRS